MENDRVRPKQKIAPLVDLIDENQRLRAENEQLKRQLATHVTQEEEIEILKATIVRNVSHEIRTPLLQVKSAVAMIADDMDEKSSLIKFAEKAIEKLDIIARNITMLGESLSVDVKLEPVIVRDTLHYAIRNLSKTWEAEKVHERVQIYIEDKLPPTLAHKQGLNIVLQLLLDNALKFSDDKPVNIEITHDSDSHKIRFVIIDKGIGIGEHEFNKIFDLFYQCDGSIIREYEGTGIGLTLVRLILQKHNSTIEFESELNRGSTFSFTLDAVNFDNPFAYG